MQSGAFTAVIWLHTPNHTLHKRNPTIPLSGYRALIPERAGISHQTQAGASSPMRTGGAMRTLYGVTRSAPAWWGVLLRLLNTAQRMFTLCSGDERENTLTRRSYALFGSDPHSRRSICGFLECSQQEGPPCSPILPGKESITWNTLKL